MSEDLSPIYLHLPPTRRPMAVSSGVQQTRRHCEATGHPAALTRASREDYDHGRGHGRGHGHPPEGTFQESTLQEGTFLEGTLREGTFLEDTLLELSR